MGRGAVRMFEVLKEINHQLIISIMERVSKRLDSFEGQVFSLNRFQIMNILFKIQENMERMEIHGHNLAMEQYYQGKLIDMGEMLREMALIDTIREFWIPFREDQGKSVSLPWEGYIEL